MSFHKMTYIKYTLKTLLTLLWVRLALIDFKGNKTEVPKIPVRPV